MNAHIAFVLLPLIFTPLFAAPAVKTRNGHLIGIQLPQAQAFFR